MQWAAPVACVWNKISPGLRSRGKSEKYWRALTLYNAQRGALMD
jgi:hypothetical protein